MEIVLVKTSSQYKEFLHFPKTLYTDILGSNTKAIIPPSIFLRFIIGNYKSKGKYICPSLYRGA